jgi:hypothetical protein
VNAELDRVARQGTPYRPSVAAVGGLRDGTIRDDDGQRRND